MLGLGLGLSKGSTLLSNLKLLTRNSDWAIWADKATGTSKGTNSPQVNPIMDLAGVVGKNLFDGFLESGSYYITDGDKIVDANIVRTTFMQKIKPSTLYRLRVETPTTSTGVWKLFYDKDKIFIASSMVSSEIFTTPINAEFMTFYSLTTTDVNTRIMLSEGNDSPAYEPYGKSNGLLTGFAMTPASGYVDVVAPNGKTVTGVQGDAVNDVILLPSNAPNPVGLQDFGFAFVFKTPSAIIGYISYRGSDTYMAQWSVYVYADGRLEIATQNIGVIVSSVGAVKPNTFNKLVYKRVSSVLYVYLNGVLIYQQPNTSVLTTMNNCRLLARSSSVDGTVNANYSGAILFYADYNNGTDIDAWEADQNKAIAKIYGL